MSFWELLRIGLYGLAISVGLTMIFFSVLYVALR
jgi:hypothetical protein